jgi:CPA1 family monovalent cation:H+ antiporter
VALLLQLPLPVALLFGSIVAATDPVAVTSVFHRLHAPYRLTAIAEGESLLNDGMAITLYTALLRLATTGQLDPFEISLHFAQEVLGGVAVGCALGFAFSRLTGTLDDALTEMTLSTVLAYGSYLGAQAFHFSGPLACVAAGFIHGSYGRRIGMSETTRRQLDDLWEYLGFFANGLVFLLVGFSVNLGSLWANAWPALVAIGAVLLARVLLLIGPALLIPQRPLGTSHGERVVLAWSGLRGALTIALAVALPPTMTGRDLLVAMAFAVVLFTLVVQALTLPLLLRRAGLAGSPRPPAH